MRLRQLLSLSLFLGALAVGTSGAATAGDDELVPHSSRVALRGIATDLSKLGLRQAVERMNAILERAGDSPGTLAKLRKTWERNLARDPRGKSSRSVLAKLEAQTTRIADQIAEAPEPRRTDLIELVLQLDSQEPRANEASGHALHAGRWMPPEEIAWEEGRRYVADLVQEARRFALEVETGASEVPVFDALPDGHGPAPVLARAHGITLHARMNPAKLARVLRQALRAAALSNVLLTDVLAIPSFPDETTILFMDSSESYEAALVEARDNGGLAQADYERNVDEAMRSFADRRGWRTSRWRTEADYQALVLWILVQQLLGPDAQPCLEAGHLNWLALEFLGTSMPIVAWLDASGPGSGAARTTATKQNPFQTEALWRSARHTLHGCRSWMIRCVLEERDPPWSRSMVDHVGKVTDENLLKSTLMTAFLQETGAFQRVLAATRGNTERVATFEAALATQLPEFDERWRRWLLGTPAIPPGLAQLVASPPETAAEDERRAAVLDQLNRNRQRALAGQWAEFGTLAFDDELSAGALAHARYLERNEEQQQAWPDAHEEYADREGFTPAGSRAGRHGVIAFTEDPLEAIEQWMGTFYHRLPLLDPGLFGVGLASAGGVTVLDVSSLVLQPWREHWVRWPHDGMRDVPRAFVPELPNPVPGEDQAAWGYPITLQAFLPGEDGVLDVRLRLLEADGGAEVDCWFLTPMQPYFDELAPRNAWALIPKERLSKGTRYEVEIEGAGPQGQSWAFETE